MKISAFIYEGKLKLRTEGKPGIYPLISATKIRPDLPEPWYELGLAHTAYAHKLQAIDALQKALLIEPYNPKFTKAMEEAKAIPAAVAFVEGAKTTARGASTFLWGCIALLTLIMVVQTYQKLSQPETYQGEYLVIVLMSVFGWGLVAGLLALIARVLKAAS